MKFKKYILRTVKILSLLLALVLCIGFLQQYVLCHSDHNRERIFGFYLEPKNSLDVVLIGASEVYADYAAVTHMKSMGTQVIRLLHKVILYRIIKLRLKKLCVLRIQN